MRNKKGTDRDKEKSLKIKHNKENSKNNDNRMEKKTDEIVMPLCGLIICSCKTNDIQEKG